MSKMEVETAAAEKLYRLRLVLPELSQAFVGNWITSLNKAIPPEFFHDDDGLFDPPERKRFFVIGPGRRNLKAVPNHQIPARGDADRECARTESAKICDRHEIWLRVGEMATCGPVLQTWEFCHGLENWLLEKALEESRENISPRLEIANSLSNSRPCSPKSTIGGSKLNAAERSLKSFPRSQSKIILESDLVRDALYALQGLPAAVRKLERLSKTYCTTSADKSAHNLSTLWNGSVTASALGKVLWVLSRSGYVRCQLDAFVSFFLDRVPDALEGNTDDAPSLPSKAPQQKKNKKSKKHVALEVKEAEKHFNCPKVPVNYNASSAKKVPSHCLVNQAFAAAVKGILRGHSAALNTLASSVSLRRVQKDADPCRGLPEHDPGPVIGYGSRDISLLEFYLHTRELRVQLQALACICLMRDGKSIVGSSAGDVCSENWMDTKDNEGERAPRKCRKTGLEHWSGDDRADPLMRGFEDFPRGTDLLTYLYDQLMEVDPLHVELLRFLFERAYGPYSLFIRSWLYQAAVRDPYGEFVIEQADFCAISSNPIAVGKGLADLHRTGLKMRSGLSVPRFMENVCTPLIRAGEQLQVLLKLAETSDLAQQMANNNTQISEMFEGLQNSMFSTVHPSRTSLCLPALVFSKRKLDETVNQREMKSQELRKQFDSLFAELASRRLKKEKSKTRSSFSMPESLSVYDDITEIVDKQGSATGSDLQKQASWQSSSNLQSGQDFSDGKSLDIKVILPKRGWLTSAKEEEAADESLPCSKDKSQSLWQSSNEPGPVTLTVKEILQADRATGKVTRDATLLQVDFQDPIQALCVPDNRRATKGLEKGNRPSEVQSLISDHQRGTSWPLWGLPLNPFLIQTNVDDFSCNSYVHTSFMGTYHHWDLTAKSTVGSIHFTEASGLETSKEFSRHGREISIEPPWFASLELALHDQLFKGLDAQIKLSGWTEGGIDSAELEARLFESSQPLSQVPLALEQRQSNPHTFTLQEHAESEVAGDEPSFERPMDILKFSSGPDSEADDPTDLELPQRLEDSLKFSSRIEPKMKTPADKASSKDTDVHELLLESPLIESYTENGGSSVLLLEYFMTENDCSLSDFGEVDSLNMFKETALVRLGESDKTPGRLEKIPKLSECKVDEDKSRDSEIGQAAFSSEISDFGQRKVDDPTELVKSQSPKNESIHGPAKWEQYLRFSNLVSPVAIKETTDNGIDDDVSADEEIPLSVVVSKCIAEEIFSQYQSVSTLTVRLFREALSLQDHYAALRRYFFMERGDWAEYFATALCQHRWGILGGQLRQMEVQGMLEAAFQRSSCEGDEYGERVFVSFRQPKYYGETLLSGSTKTSLSLSPDCSRLEAFDFIALEYRVDWPLNLILTSHSLHLYNVVFTFLMHIKFTVYALGDIWQRLQVMDRLLHKVRGSSAFQQQRNRFRSCQQFRQQIHHFVTTVQRYVESKLLSDVWSQFLEDIQMEVNDMQDLKMMHCAYLEDAIEKCFLSTKTSGVKGCIDSIMQCVLDFSSFMKNSFHQSGEMLDLIDDRLFAQVHQVKKGFQASLQQLHDYLLKQEPQSQTNLMDLWMILDFNGFLTNALSTTQL